MMKKRNILCYMCRVCTGWYLYERRYLLLWYCTRVSFTIFVCVLFQPLALLFYFLKTQLVTILHFTTQLKYIQYIEYI